MNEQDSSFEQLHKLLALKKHEIPPPGYFNNFSSQVVSRIRLGETAKKSEGLLGSLFSEAPWMLKVIRIFEAKPAYAGVFASLLCLLLVAGIVVTDHSEAPADLLMPTQTAQTTSSSSSLSVLPASFLAQTAPQPDMVSSTNPVLNFQPASMNFGSQGATFQQAIFTH